MKRYTVIVIALFISFCFAQAQIKWYNPLEQVEPAVSGRAWNKEIGKSYNRLPLRAKQTLRPAVWNLSTNSAGLSISFYTDAPEILIRYKVSGKNLNLKNVVTIAASGLDMYATDDSGHTNWCACPCGYFFGKASNDTITYHYTDLEYHNSIKRKGNEYQIFLPLYNTVSYLEIGVPQKNYFLFANTPQEKPIVVYGTSIAQGASASRPAMCWTNILQRRLETPIINLGFAGNGTLDPEVFNLISEINAQLFIIDCMPNMFPTSDSIVHRTIEGVKKIRQKSNAPILIVENYGTGCSKTNKPIEDEIDITNRECKKAYEKLILLGINNIYYLSKSDIGLTSDAQIDGWHPSDVGMEEYANAYIKKINEIWGRKTMKLFSPCKQCRDLCYNWPDRHNEVLIRNRTTNPDILLIGNSITHFWGGLPANDKNWGQQSWNKIFGSLHVTNMGFGWDRIENVFWRIFHGELDDCKPKQIFLMIGTNNLTFNTNEEIVDGILGLVNLIHQKQPQAKLHVIKIYPRRNMESRIDTLNNLLQKRLVIDNKTNLTDVGSYLLLKDSNKINESLFRDGLHPNELGYKIIGRIYQRLLQK